MGPPGRIAECESHSTRRTFEVTEAGHRHTPKRELSEGGRRYPPHSLQELTRFRPQVAFTRERYKKLRAVELIDEIPKTPSGKVLRRALIDRERTAARPGQRQLPVGLAAPTGADGPRIVTRPPQAR
jgi:acyl-CoA synthetase (AMP-forming)/AMP-acid ligase II